jgi:hypothetical protein
MNIRNPNNGESFRICPGGGLEDGEDLPVMEKSQLDSLSLASKNKFLTRFLKGIPV